jgi:hypothetical protein
VKDSEVMEVLVALKTYMMAHGLKSVEQVKIKFKIKETRATENKAGWVQNAAALRNATAKLVDSELALVLKKLDIRDAQRKAKKVISAIDVDGDGHLDMEEVDAAVNRAIRIASAQKYQRRKKEQVKTRATYTTSRSTAVKMVRKAERQCITSQCYRTDKGSGWGNAWGASSSNQRSNQRSSDRMEIDGPTLGGKFRPCSAQEKNHPTMVSAGVGHRPSTAGASGGVSLSQTDYSFGASRGMWMDPDPTDLDTASAAAGMCSAWVDPEEARRSNQYAASIVQPRVRGGYVCKANAPNTARYQKREDSAIDIGQAALRALAHEQRSIPSDYRPYFVQ